MVPPVEYPAEEAVDWRVLVSWRLSAGPKRVGLSRSNVRCMPSPTTQAMSAAGKASPVFSPT